MDIAAPVEPIDIAAPVEPIDIAAPVEPIDIAAPPEPIDIAAPPEPMDVAAPAAPVDVAAPQQPAPVAEPGGTEPPAPASPAPPPPPSAAPAATGSIPSSGFSGTSKGSEDLMEEMLEPFPAKGTGFPLPAETSNYRLFSVIASNAASGILEFTSEAGNTQVFFRRGTMLAIEPFGKQFDEYFASVIDKAVLSEPERFEEVLQFAEENDKSLALSLYEKRVISLDMLSQELKAAKEKCLGEVLLAEGETQYSFQSMQKFSRRFDPIRVDLRSALIGICRDSLLSKFARHIEPRLEFNRDKFPRALRDAEIPLELLSLSEKEEHAVKHVFTGANRLMDTYSMCLLTRHGAARLVLLLTHYGLMEYLEEAAETQSGESIEEVLARTLDSMRTMDHFQRLDIHWAGHPSLVEKGLEKAKRRYGPQSSLSRRSDEAKETCAKLIATLEESYHYLTDKANRRNHRVEHYGEAKMKYAADFLASQAELNMFRGAQENAIQLIEAALELSPDPSYVTKLRKYRAGQR